MTRLLRARVAFARRTILAAAVLAAAVAVPVGALARSAPPQPEMERWPATTALRSAPVLAGSLEGGVEGDEVTLLRRIPGRPWTEAKTVAVGPDGELRTSVRGVRVTSFFRWRWSDGAVSTVSDQVKVRVRPQLDVSTRPARIMQGGGVKVRGRLLPITDRTRWVRLQVHRDGAWRPLARARVRKGHFAVRAGGWGAGRHAIRAVFRGDARNAAGRSLARLTVYDPDLATWYGPGLYGNGTACGQVLEPGTLGVAHRTLPCGTVVSLFYQGRSITVRVIDRGPYSAAEWDLTEATARRIGFYGTDEVGTVH